MSKMLKIFVGIIAIGLIAFVFQNCAASGGGTTDGGGGGSGTPNNNSALTATFSFVSYYYDTGSSPAPINITGASPSSNSYSLRRPLGFSAELINVVFDGAGNFSMSGTKNKDGTATAISNSGTYTLATDGGLTIGIITGQLASNGKVAVLANNASGNPPEINVGVLKDATSTSVASLNGAYTQASFYFDSGTSQPQINIVIPGSVLSYSNSYVQGDPRGFTAEIATITFDGAGNFSMSGTKNKDGVSSALSASGTYSVAANGSVTVSNINGQMLADGTFLALSTIAAANDPEITVIVKNNGSGMSVASLNGNYLAACKYFDMGSGQGNININMPSFPYSGTFTQNASRNYSSEVLNLTFDGAGGFSMTGTKNKDGVVSSVSPMSGSYTVGAGGALTIANLAGQVLGDGTTAVFGQVTNGNAPEICVAVKK